MAVELRSEPAPAIRTDVVQDRPVEHDRCGAAGHERERRIEGVHEIAAQQHRRVGLGDRRSRPEPCEPMVVLGPDERFEPRPGLRFADVDRHR
jgi:hypothetical protein